MDNQSIRKNILAKLTNDPKVDTSKIGVNVDNGTVTLTGYVNSMELCAHIEKLASDVLGVEAIIQEIKHSHTHIKQPQDEEIAANILGEFKRNALIPDDQLQVYVQDGRVTVNGDVYWLYQKNAVSVVLESVNGILDKANHICIINQDNDHDLEALITAELAKIDNLNSNSINIKCESGAVTLTGLIKANVERATVIHTVNSIAGVRFILDQLRPVK